MNNTQIKNTLDWVDAMLSGNYRYHEGSLRCPKTDSYCAIGVAAEIMGIERFDTENNTIYLFNERDAATLKPSKKTHAVPETWFKRTFGLPHMQNFYSTLSDRGKNYLGVCAQLLEAVRITAPNNERVAVLQQKLYDAAAVWSKSGGL